MIKIKDIYHLFDVALYIYIDGKFVTSSIDIDAAIALNLKDIYNYVLNKEVKAITVGDCEVAIEC